MKIAIFTDAWTPQVNGIVTHLANIIPLLAEKHEVHVCTFKSKGVLDLPDNVFLHTARSTPLPIYPEVRATHVWSKVFDRVVKEVRPDVIHAHTPLTIGAAGVMLSQKFHIPLVMTFHTYFADPEYLKTAGLGFLGLHKSSALQDIAWWMLGMLYNKADVIISPSRTTTADIQTHFKDSIRYITIPPGVHAQRFRKPRMTEAAMRKRYKLTQDYFIYVGRLSKEKNIDELIDAFHHSALWKGKDRKSLVIVGSGPMEELLKKQVMRLKLQKHVLFLGRISQADLQTSGLYNRALAFVSMSTSETYGLTYVEAMASGLPIIVIDAKAATELFSGNGALCEPHNSRAFGEAMSAVIGDTAQLARMRKQSLRVAEEQSVERAVKMLEKVYASVTSR